MKISADARIIECHNFQTDEAALTGESIANTKSADAIDVNTPLADRTNMVYAGTTVVTGRALAVVTATGTKTEIGKIASTIHNTKEEKSPLTIRIDKFSKQISVIIIIISIIIAALLISKGESSFNEILLSVIALAVSAMPEGLPLALTMALTIASNKMAKRKVVAKQLYSVESLGSCTVIASDKTGTLTVNEQTAKKIVLPNGQEYMVTGSGYNLDGEVVGEDLAPVKEIAKYGMINNEAKFNEKEHIGDSVDIAFLVLAGKLKTKVDDMQVVESIPYESENKYSAVFYEKDGETYCTIKGSIEVVASFCNKTNLRKTFDVKALEELARVIGDLLGTIKKPTYTP